jgi:hypothetical protein
MCPAEKKNVHKQGNKGTTTRTYQCICSHSKKILHVGEGYPGTFNDMRCVKKDPVIMSLFKRLWDVNGTFKYKHLRNVEWTTDKFDLITGVVSQEKQTGTYLIVDGGYMKTDCMISPLPVTLDIEHQAWTTMLESTRKDIECTFGILKKRFTILTSGIRFFDTEKADKVFLVCCILHNMNHECNGWDDDFVWVEEGEEVPEEDEEFVRTPAVDDDGVCYDIDATEYSARLTALVGHYHVFHKTWIDANRDFYGGVVFH